MVNKMMRNDKSVEKVIKIEIFALNLKSNYLILSNYFIVT